MNNCIASARLNARSALHCRCRVVSSLPLFPYGHCFDDSSPPPPLSLCSVPLFPLPLPDAALADVIEHALDMFPAGASS